MASNAPVRARIWRTNLSCALRKQLSFSQQRRPLSSSATDVASRLVERFADSVTIRRQRIDAIQLQKLVLTLGRTHLGDTDVSNQPPAEGTPVPAGYHLVYFTPAAVEAQIGADGSDLTYNASEPFSRRMWAGGHMRWASAASRKEVQLLVGDEAEEHTRLVSATAKKSRSGGEMVLVEVEKEIRTPRGCAVLDRRSWMFRPKVEPTSTVRYSQSTKNLSGPSIARDLPADQSGSAARQLCWSPVGLFRFSALTFNGHMIHYNQEWCQSVEAHPTVVVHGPLNLVCLLDYWRDIHGNGEAPSSIRYRALSPLYAGETYAIRTQQHRQEASGQVYDVVAERDGLACMRAEIVA